MTLKIKAAWFVIPIVIALSLASCNPSTAVPETEVVETEAVNETSSSQPVLKTNLGDFIILSSRLVDEVHEQKSPSGNEFLLVVLTQPDLKNLLPGDFSLEAFQKMVQDSSGKIYVTGKDDTQFISTMAGWVEDEFTMGFTVSPSESYTLHWPGNSLIELNP